MVSIIHRAGAWALACATVAAAAPAHADIFELRWGYRWASGTLQHDAGIVDSDPSALRDVYADSVLGYDFSGLRIEDFSFPHLVGSGGSIVVDKAAPGSGDTDTFTFLLGAAVPGDAASYRLVARIDPEFQFQPHGIAETWVASLSGGLYRNDAFWALGMSPGYPTFHSRLAAPVPEPASWGLFGVGLAGLAVGRRFRR